MTPKEKAKELVNKMYMVSTNVGISFQESKQCALITVDELIKHTPSFDSKPPNYQTINEFCSEYWIQVKQEIEKL